MRDKKAKIEILKEVLEDYRRHQAMLFFVTTERKTLEELIVAKIKYMER